MLPDGTNPEGVDPEPPLGWKDKSSFKDVTLVAMPYSPPCTKIRYHLAFADIPFTVMKESEYKKGKDKEKNYCKVPVLFNDGKQVNDSYIILKNIIPAIYGPQSFNEEWEKKLTYGLQLAIEVEAFEDKRNWPVFLGFVGFPGFVASILPCVLPFFKMASSIRTKRAAKDDKFGPLRPAKEYMDEFKAEVGEKKFHGGAEPDAVDVSCYATICDWMPLPYIQELVEESKLKEWVTSMEEKMPKNVPNA